MIVQSITQYTESQFVIPEKQLLIAIGN